MEKRDGWGWESLKWWIRGIWCKYLNSGQVFVATFYKGKTELQRIEAACSETWLLRVYWLQPVHVPLGYNASQQLCLMLPDPKLFPPSYKMFQNWKEDLPLSFWKQRGTLSPSHPKPTCVGHSLDRKKNLWIYYSRFFLNNRKWRSFCGWFGKGHLLIKATGGLLINCYLISVQCFFVAQICL